ncbi:MAG: class I SAM-dependent methyltransferase, partial [Myxococcota bacterium]|nr:class I SAM-dependent methyltransferase [Myxococcota bacterium]
MSERALRDPGRSSVLPAAEEKRQSVQSMFDRIAPRYDLLNRLLTLGLDQRWRRLALDTVGVSSDDLVLDIACGTGDLAEA